jgi:hypothetical protein
MLSSRVSFARATLATGAALLMPWAADAADLKLDRVLLSTGGVGYYEWSAEVEGNAELPLVVRKDQVDDVLKSLIVLDDKGGVGSVSLPGRDPVPQLFQDLPFGPEALASPAALLEALKGARIEVATPRAIAGRVLSVAAETSTSPDGKVLETRHRVSVVTSSGVEQFVLEDAGGIKLADPALQAQVDAALDGLAANRAQDRRTLSVTARGEGRRTVRVAYVAGAPLWKAAYRLAVDASGKARLQGWAVLENMTGADWKDVSLTLVSGSPVTFRQALYAAYYLNRPEVPVEVVGRVLPGIDQGGIRQLDDLRKSKAARVLSAPASPDMAMENKVVADAVDMPAPEPEMAAPAGGTNAADSQTQVAFRVAKPVSVESGRSLTLPILDRPIAAERVAFYQRSVDPRHPLAAFALTNDGETSLPPGIVTLYERAREGDLAYSGDARLPALPAGARRMLSFALDTRTLVDVAGDTAQRIAEGRIANGVFTWRTILRSSTTYTVAAPPKEARRLILEHPRQPGWDLVSPSGKVETTDEAWRLPLDVAAGATGALEVVLERPETQSLALASANPDQILAWASARELDAATRERFRKIAALQADAAAKARQVELLDQQRRELMEEQARLRANLEAVPAQSDLHARYMKSLDAQETRIEAVAKDLDAARAARTSADDALRAELAA